MIRQSKAIRTKTNNEARMSYSFANLFQQEEEEAQLPFSTRSHLR